jgi:hypothetical protein
MAFFFKYINFVGSHCKEMRYNTNINKINSSNWVVPMNLRARHVLSRLNFNQT